MKDVYKRQAYYCEIHPGIISEAMGHSSITVTETYLKPFRNKKIDEANKQVLDFVKRSVTVSYTHLDVYKRQVKSFSILQLLLKNGFLQKDTLLIIDEPEAHLHPQWIVEYARMIVLLHKEIGVKFFVASHSTDMILSLIHI